jgi:hypothetical protein
MSTKIIIYRAIGIAILAFVVIKIVFPVLRGVLSLLFPIIAMGIVLFLLSTLAFVFKNSVTYSKKFKDFISDLLGDPNNPDDKKQ